jgi:diguanylate cyclase (GGDEF)-like protein
VFLETFLAPACTASIGTLVGAPLAAVAVCLPQVAAAAWLVRTRWGVVVTLAGGVGWYLPLLAGRHPVDHSSAVLGTMVCLGFAMLAGRLRHTVRHAQRAAETDDLTRLLNKRGFQRRLEGEANRSVRTGRSLAVAFLDCDDFKAVNDTQGHAAGDRLLQTVAQTLERNVRNYDSVARMGGDEFAILFPEMPPEQAQATADRLVATVRAAMQAHDRNLSVSAGVVVFEQPGDVDDMLAAADAEMYAVKRSGKGRAGVRVISRPSADNPSPAA